MVSELDGGQPPSPVSMLEGVALEAPHPAGTVSVVVRLPVGLPPRPPSPAVTLPPPPPQQQHAQPPAEEADAMQMDALQDQLPLSRSVRPALHPPPDSQQHVSDFVPLSEVGGGGAAPQPRLPQDSLQQQQQQQASASLGSSLLEEPSSHPERPASATGYESGDDMDVLSMRHCTNCTGTLWGPICMDCGHMPAHDADIFQPTVAPAGALHRPRLQGDAATVICWDERMELHEEAGPSMHPERPDRVRAVMARLHAAELAGRCRRMPAREATPAEVTACHIPELLAAVDVMSEQSRLTGGAGLHFSPDTYVNQHTALCAKLSAGACVDVARAVVRGEARAGVAIVRPPGHHAESNTAAGFCFFNNAGIAARAAQAAGAERVLVLDWDVHHGNGTQHIFEEDPSVLYMSLHRYDGGSFYPGTGAAHEVGEGPGEGFIVNVPWPCGGMRNGDYLAAFQHVVLPIAYEYAPDLVIISAGFDAAEGDPIGGCHLTPEAYAHMAAQLQLVAPTVALLEGGYNLLSTAAGTEAVVRVLLGERPPTLPAAEQAPGEYAMATVAQVMRIQARYWDCMRGLVAQQFKILAADAARQQQLAAMKQRRADALGHANHSHGGSGEEEEEEGGEGQAWQEEDDEEQERQLMQQAQRRPHGLDLLDDADTDTPHQQYRGGSGWESDADLASDEQLSEDDGSDTSGEEQQQQQQGEEAEALLPAGGEAAASPPRDAEAQWGSDTAPISDSEVPGSGSVSDGTNQQQSGGQVAGLTSGSLSPPGTTPASQSLLAVAPDAPADREEEEEEEEAHPPEGSGGAAAWRGLAVKAVPLKRPGHVGSHQRLSPALVDDEAMALVRPQGTHPHSDQSEQLVPQRP